jgi:hypothetical protein
MTTRQLLDLILAEDRNFPEVQKLGRRGGYDLVEKGNSTLFVSIGDSWTYGHRLNEEAPSGTNSDAFRVEHTYGYLVSQHLEADYLNLAFPATNNIWMVNRYRAICQIANQLPYDRIIVHITFTEYGREIATDFDLDPELNQQYSQANTIRDLAVKLCEYNEKRLTPHDKIKLTCGINYVTNLYSTDLMLDKTWLEVLLGKSTDDECLVVGSWVIPKFKELTSFNSKVDKTVLLEDLTRLTESANTRLDLIYNTGFNYKTGYGHPNASGHKLWAEYIINQMVDQK